MNTISNSIINMVDPEEGYTASKNNPQAFQNNPVQNQASVPISLANDSGSQAVTLQSGKAENNTSNSSGSSNSSGAVNNSSSGKNQKTSNSGEKIYSQVHQDLNPSPFLQTAYIFKWDGKDGGTVVNIIDNATGKTVGTIPPQQVLKMMHNYSSGMLFSSQS